MFNFSYEYRKSLDMHVGLPYTLIASQNASILFEWLRKK